MNRLEQIRKKYLAGQNTLDFTQQGGNFAKYALLLLNEHDTDDLVRGY